MITADSRMQLRIRAVSCIMVICLLLELACGSPSSHRRSARTMQKHKLTYSSRRLRGAKQKSSPFWEETHHSRTLYIESFAGLGNRLRSLASAMTLARDRGVNVKVVWRPELGNDKIIFNSTWGDLFEAPHLSTSPNFPGGSTAMWSEDDYPEEGKDKCTVRRVSSFPEWNASFVNGWEWVEGKEVLCLRVAGWFTEGGPSEGMWFFSHLTPSPPVASQMQAFRERAQWEEKMWACVHIRRQDLNVMGKEGVSHFVKDLLPLSEYVTAMNALAELGSHTEGTRFFLASDDAEAEREVRVAFEEGRVWTLSKSEAGRATVEGAQEAAVDLLLLSSCPVLIGTYYSSYSELAKFIGGAYYIQVGSHLADISKLAAWGTPENQEVGMWAGPQPPPSS